MSNDVMVLAEHTGKQVADATYELLGAARGLADSLGGRVLAALLGPAELAGSLSGAEEVFCVEHPGLASYLAEPYEQALLAVLAEAAPRVLLLANDTVGMDLGSAISIRWPAPLAAYVTGLRVDGDTLVATCQILAGKLLAEVALDSPTAVCTVLAGAFRPIAPGSAAPAVRMVAAPAELNSPRMSLERLLEPQGGDVDITTAELLVSVGRGIGSADNLEVVQELADALGAPLSASRPVIDAGWLPKTRQVGKSGLKVKPKAYLCFGISGAPEHLEGMRDAELIIACNTDPKAPIFEVAHYGTTADLFDLIPAIVEGLTG